jgi:hypothetical protein
MKNVLRVTLLVAIVSACGGDKDPTAPQPPPTAAAVSTVTLSNAPDELEVGATATVGVTLRDAAGNTLTGRTITWTTGSSSVATVSGAGVVTGAGTGSTSITATSEGRTASFTVTVDTRTGFLTAIVESVRAAHDLPALTGAIVTRGGGMFGTAASGRRRISDATRRGRMPRLSTARPGGGFATRLTPSS